MHHFVTLFELLSITERWLILHVVKMRRIVWFVLLAMGSVTHLYGQSSGDWRTRNDGNWNGTDVWQLHNGTSWQNTTSFPTGLTTGHINIRAHAITATEDIIQEDGVAKKLLINPSGTLNMGSYQIYAILNPGPSQDTTQFNKVTVNGNLYTSGGVSADTFNIGTTGHFKTSYANSNGAFSVEGVSPEVGTDNFNGLFEYSGSGQGVLFKVYEDLLISGDVSTLFGAVYVSDLTITGTLTSTSAGSTRRRTTSP